MSFFNTGILKIISFFYCFLQLSMVGVAQELPPIVMDPVVENKTATIITSYKKSLDEEHQSFISKLAKRQDEVEGHLRELANLSVEEDSQDLSGRYLEVSNIWGDSVDQLFEVFLNAENASNLDAPEIDELEKEFGEEATSKAMLLMLEEAKAHRNNLTVLRHDLLNAYKIQNLRLLQESGRLRAQLLEACDKVQCERQRGLNSMNLHFLSLEMKAIPLKMIIGSLSKWTEIRSKTLSGIDGWLDLGKQIFLLSLVFFIPFILVKSLRWTSVNLELWKRNLLSKSIMDYRKRTSMAIWIGHLNPFVLSTGMVLSIAIARLIIEGTDLSVLSNFLFYFQIYYIYRFLRVLLELLLEMVFNTSSMHRIKQQKELVSRSAARISRLIFVEFVVFQLIEDAARQALAYQLFSTIIFWLNILFLMVESHKWKKEIENSFEIYFPKSSKKVDFLFASWFRFFAYPFALMLVILHKTLNFIYSKLLRFDLVKRAMSEVLRKQLEKSESEKVEIAQKLIPPPAEYLSYFDYALVADEEIFIDLNQGVATQSVERICSWMEGDHQDDLLIIVGNRGLGKSTCLRHIHKQVSSRGPKMASVYERLDQKILCKEDLFDWLSKVLNTNITSIADVEAYDRSLEKRLVVFIDDIHNLFLAYVGGFYAYRTFLEIINLKTGNIFWCLTVNSRSWEFLKGVVGEEHFYGVVMPLRPWKDYEIQRLIMSRHKLTGFTRKFDQSIKAYSTAAEMGQQVELQFFRLLWGQARGNPRSALMYWISAISSPRENEIFVGVPAFINSLQVSSMSDDALFLLSALARHDNLTQVELRNITKIEELVIRKCLKEAEDKSLIWQDDEAKFRISSRAQNVIDYFLVGKNFLYE